VPYSFPALSVNNRADARTCKEGAKLSFWCAKFCKVSRFGKIDSFAWGGVS
jgi:hypothetical protein